MQIDLEQLARLIAIAEQANIDELEVSDHEQTIRITCNHPSLPTSKAVHPAASHTLGYQTPPLLAVVQPQTVDTTMATTQAVESTKNLADESNTPANAPQQTIDSPMVGTFYRRASPDTPVFIKAQTQVNVGDTLCIIEAMKIMHEVKATQAGVVKKILVNDGDMVEYGQPLIEMQA